MKVELIIPRKDNDGSDNAAVIRAAITRFCETFGGATVLDGAGYWLDAEGTLYEDQIALIMSAATEATAARDELVSIARRVLDLTDQKAVFLSVNGKAEIIE